MLKSWFLLLLFFLNVTYLLCQCKLEVKQEFSHDIKFVDKNQWRYYHSLVFEFSERDFKKAKMWADSLFMNYPDFNYRNYEAAICFDKAHRYEEAIGSSYYRSQCWRSTGITKSSYPRIDME